MALRRGALRLLGLRQSAYAAVVGCTRVAGPQYSHVNLIYRVISAISGSPARWVVVITVSQHRKLGAQLLTIVCS